MSRFLDIYLCIVAPGNVADHVVIEQESESTIILADGARDTYLGYATFKVNIYYYMIMTHILKTFEKRLNLNMTEFFLKKLI